MSLCKNVTAPLLERRLSPTAAFQTGQPVQTIYLGGVFTLLFDL